MNSYSFLARFGLFTVCLILTANIAIAADPWAISLQVKYPEVQEDKGETVYINEVFDNREFDSSTGPDHSIVSSPDTRDSALTEEIIGRWRDRKNLTGYLAIEKGQRIPQLVGDAVAEAFRRAGYGVVPKSQGEKTGAIPVNVDLRLFWIWSEPNPEVRNSYYFNARAEALVESAVPPFGLPSLVGGTISGRGKRPEKEVSWIRTGNRGIEAFVENTAVLLRYPPAAAIGK